MKKLVQNGEVLFPKSGKGRPRRKKFLKDLESDFTGLSTILKTVFNTQGTRELRSIFEEKELLDFPKPKDLLKIPITQGSNKDSNDIILDFFSGSGTTAHAVIDLNKEDGGNRKFICVQMPEECDEKSEAFKAGYKTIAEIGKERIRRVIKKIKAEQEGKLDFGEAEQDLGFKAFKLRPSNFKIWRSAAKSGDDLAKELDLFTDPVTENSATENIMYELLLKSGIDLNAKIEEKNGALWINEGEVALLLANISSELIDSLAEAKPQKIIALDRLFAGNDQLKSNAVLRFQDEEIDFKTV